MKYLQGVDGLMVSNNDTITAMSNYLNLEFSCKMPPISNTNSDISNECTLFRGNVSGDCQYFNFLVADTDGQKTARAIEDRIRKHWLLLVDTEDIKAQKQNLGIISGSVFLCLYCGSFVSLLITYFKVGN